MTRLFAAVFCLSMAPVTGAAEGGDGPLFDAANDVVILGEIHDNPGHHLRQAEVVAALAPTAVVWEMLSPAQAEIVSAQGASDAALGWSESGWPDFAIYAPVFEAAAGRPVYGGALPRDLVRSAISASAVEVAPPGLARFGLGEALPEDQQALREAGQNAAHCDALPAEMLPGFVEAQRLRDAALAAAVLEALEAHGAPVVLITGNGHARTDWGVPSLIAHAAPDVQVVSLGQFEGEMAPADGPPFDLTAVSPPAQRPDPCAAFRNG